MKEELKELFQFNIDPCPDLEMQNEFSTRLTKIKSKLSAHERIELNWLINRSYFSGYKQGDKDNG